MSTDPAPAPEAPSKPRRRRKRTPKRRAPLVQLGGLHAAAVATLAAPRRVAIAVQAVLWNDLSPRTQAILQRGVAWRLVAVDSVPVTVSEPLDVGGKAHQRIVRKLGMEFVTFESRGLQRWSHLARVRYRDGRVVVFGAPTPAESIAEAEQSTPIATFEVDGGPPTPWEGMTHGHLPAELLDAPTFDKATPDAPPTVASNGHARRLPGL